MGSIFAQALTAAGLGSERERAPRSVIAGEERKAALAIIDAALAQRPEL